MIHDSSITFGGDTVHTHARPAVKLEEWSGSVQKSEEQLRADASSMTKMAKMERELLMKKVNDGDEKGLILMLERKKTYIPVISKTLE